MNSTEQKRSVPFPWLVSGILFGTAFLHPWMWWLFIPALVLFIHSAVRARSRWSVVGGSVCVGTLKAAGAIAWFWHTYPLTWVELGPPLQQVLFIGFYWAHVSLAIGMGMIVAGLGIHTIARRDTRYLLVFPVLLIASEVAGSLIFSALALGVGSTINISFSFGYLGYLLAYAPGFLPLAALGGVYVLSGYAGFIGVLVYIVWFERHIFSRRTWAGIITFVLTPPLVMGVWNAQIRDVSSNTMRVAVVESSLDAYQLTGRNGKRLQQQVTREASNAAFAHDVDVVIHPEGGSFLDLFQSEAEALAYVRERGGAIVIGSGNERVEEGKIVLQAHILDPEHDAVYRFGKQYLVPQGEYVIYYIAGFLKLIGSEDLVEELLGWSLYPGDSLDYTDIPSDVPAVLFCTEGVDPFAVRRLVADRDAKFIAHISSHSWFHSSLLLRPQLDRMLRVQAVWNGVPIVEAGNQSPGKAYLPDGSAIHGEFVAEGLRWKVFLYEL